LRLARVLLIAVGATAAVVLVAAAALVATDAASRWHPAPDAGTHAMVAAAADLDTYLATREDSVPGIRPGLHKAIRWQDSSTRARTPVAIVYLHGFSASRGELAPVPERLADSLGANLFSTRLAAHGLADGEGFATVTPQQWVDDAREALAVGRRIGDRVVVLGMSTGALLALQLALESDDSAVPAALILVSPNHAPADPRARLAAGALGPWITRLVVGEYRRFAADFPAHDQFWTRRYHSRGLSALMDLVVYARSLDLSAVTVPVLTLYTRHDRVVRVDLVRSRHEELGSVDKRIVDLPQATRHELASDGVAPQAVDGAVLEMLRFVRDAVR
jgi:alpha-beta hydrolase superfamily lysophospholipase